jgi:hypothetical protein
MINLLMSNYIENPFISKAINTVFDEQTNSYVPLDQENIPKYFNELFILTKLNKEPIPSEFYDLQISKKNFESVYSNFILYKTSPKVLKNKNHYDNLLVLNKDILTQFNKFGYELKDKNIVVPIFNISFLNLEKYLEQYESNNTLENIYKMKVLNNYFNLDNKNYKSIEFICSMINNLEECNYWTNYYNCLFNLTKKFNERKFKIYTARMKNQEVVKIIKQIMNNDEVDSSHNNSSSNYIKTIEQKVEKQRNNKNNYIEKLETPKKRDYVDISNALDNKFKMYKIGKPSSFTKDDINQLFNTLGEKERFLLFANLMVSKKYCHLVVNNKYILDMMNSEIKQFAPLFRYLLSYTWIRFYTEECIKKSFMKTTDEFIFDIDTASKLPLYPFDHYKPKQNPYMPILISDNDLKPQYNLCGIPDYGCFGGFGGICNLEEFRVRMNVFCTGNPNQDLFQDFDFKKYKVGISGGMISACLQKEHPLMSRFVSNNTKIEERLNNFFNEYYANSDIDVMFMAKDDYTFIDNVYNFYNQIVINICRFNANAEPNHIQLNLNKLAYIFVSYDFIEKNIKLDNIDLSENNNDKNISPKIKYIMENISTESVKQLFKPYYESLSQQKEKELIKDFTEEEVENLKKRYPDIFDINNVDFNVYINNPKYNKNYSLESKDIDLVWTYKYKINSPYLNHSLELFPTKYDDFLCLVGLFHLPCVRGYYDGSNVYLTPSCISAHMTFMNIDYKYITGTKDPIDIINKYRMRGFGTWLNSSEKKLVIKYSRNVPFWNNLYNINSKHSDKEASNNILGIMSLNHKLFRPRLYNMDEYINAPYVETSNRYNDTNLPGTINQKFSQIGIAIKNRFNSLDIKEINYDEFETIDKNGCIKPLKKWVINATWDIYNNSYKTFRKRSTSPNRRSRSRSPSPIRVSSRPRSPINRPVLSVPPKSYGQNTNELIV